jgi:O-methyltransferase
MTAAPPSLLHPDAIAAMLALAHAAPPGAFVEVGVYRGGSAWHLAALAREQHRKLHLFDTFSGIPERSERDRPCKVGDYGDASLEAVRAAIPDAEFHVGVFPATMHGLDLGPVAFVHVDCDQYRCARAAVELLLPLMPVGGVMLFDDYGITSGVTEAVEELFLPREIRRTAQGKAYHVAEAGHDGPF